MTRRVRAASHDTVRGSNGVAVAAARRLASQILSRWQGGEQSDAKSVLQGHPELRQYRSVAMNLVYEDYCRRLERGEAVDPDAFAAEFPEWRTAIRRQIEVHSYLARFPDIAGLGAPPAWPSPGDQFLGFDLREELGRGAIARVFLATERAVGDRLVAVKISPCGGAEANILGRLEHPNVVPILSVSEEAASGLSAVCMPYRGRLTFAEIIDALFANRNCPIYARELNNAYERLSQGDVVPCTAIPRCRRGLYVDAILVLVVQLADALAYTHAQEMLHRDLKPSNILLSTNGLPMLLDFNLSVDKRQTISRIGGTLPYMSPEQIRQAMFFPPSASTADDKEIVDGRTDIFALGVIAYEMLTGVQPFAEFAASPFSADAARQLLDRQKNGVAPVARLNPQVDRQVSELIASCMAFDATERPSSASELAEEIRGLLRLRHRSVRWFRFHRIHSIALASALSLAAIGGTSWYLTRPTVYQLGVAEYVNGDFVSAEGRFRRAVEEHPDSAIAWFALGSAQLRSEVGASAAKKSFKEAYDLVGDPRLLSIMVYCEASDNLPNAVGHGFQEAIEKGDDDAITYYNRAAALRDASPSAYPEAIECCRQAIERDKNLAEGYHLRGELHFLTAMNGRSGRFGPHVILRAAYDDLRHAADAVPENAQYQLDVATVACQLEKHEPDVKVNVDKYFERAVKKGLSRSAFERDVLLRNSLGDKKFQAAIDAANDAAPKGKATIYLKPSLLKRDLPDDYEAEWHRVMPPRF